MDLRQKHWALIAVGVLIAFFVLLAAYFLLGSVTVTAPDRDTATTTPSQATSTPVTIMHIRESGKYYDLDLTYPSATPLNATNPSADAAAVASMKGAMQQTASEFKKNGNFEDLTQEDIKMMRLDERKYALSSEYETYTGARTVSYVFSIYEDTLGAHPNLYFRTFTFDTKTGQEILLGNLFTSSSNYLSTLSVRARSDIPGIIKKMSGSSGDIEYIQNGTKPVAESFQNFYIDNKNLVLVFPPYQVGPYALGTVLDPIPLAQLGATLKAEYR